MVEQRTHIPYVASSNLAIGTRDWYRDCALAFQAKETSLNLVSRSRDNHRVSKLYDKLSLQQTKVFIGDMQKTAVRSLSVAMRQR